MASRLGAIRAHLEVLEHGERREDLAAFRHVRDAEAGARVRRQSADVLAAILDAAGLERHAATDRLHQRRLAGAVRSYDRHELALGDVERDAGHGVESAVRDADLRQLQHGSRGAMALPGRPEGWGVW